MRNNNVWKWKLYTVLKNEIGSLLQISSIYLSSKGTILKIWKKHCKQNVAFLYSHTWCSLSFALT